MWRYLLHVREQVVPVPPDACLLWFEQFRERIVLRSQPPCPVGAVDRAAAPERLSPGSRFIRSTAREDATEVYIYQLLPTDNLSLICRPRPIQRTAHQICIVKNVEYVGVRPVVATHLNHQDR